MKVFLALGTNQGDRMQNLQQAVDALALVPGIVVEELSSVYETEPVGYLDQPNFYNAVAGCTVSLPPHALLGACLGIEAAFGRKRIQKNGPRMIDLDVLFCDGFSSSDAVLTVPHPRMMERAFVLVPLCEISQNPLFHQACKAVDPKGVVRLSERLILPCPGCQPEEGTFLPKGAK